MRDTYIPYNCMVVKLLGHMDVSSSLYLISVLSLTRAIDIWAVGSLFSEMLTGEPLFPGESDIDQLYLITKCFGVCVCVCVGGGGGLTVWPSG